MYMEAKTHITNDALAHRFQFHPADDENTKQAHQQVRDSLLWAAGEIVKITGAPGREQSLAITKLEEAMFWANAALARGDGPST